MNIRFLSVDEVLLFHEMQIARFGGSPGLRDRGMLESAVAMPQAGFGGEFLHEDIFEMAAAYLYHIVMNHPFVDGNKRAGTHAALVFLADHGITVTLSQAEKYDLVIGVREGTVTKKGLAEALRSGSAPLAEE
ncbi:MAG: type II toxin-antitoxin system death-on-curing family toxin [Anaerosomatales bacterium]|nr:type II toxin-antitoxin system death-on-curing family toxin [Anaerosomatales bacterium]MDT8434938.1 type II toxin-antitoxin system death-on-curing family toxin [Anaerosomatales bacterium]